MNDASLRTMMYRIRSGKPVEGDKSSLASSFIYLSGLELNECGGTIDVHDYFMRLFGDDVININVDCDGGNCVEDVLLWLQQHGYASNGRFPVITQSGRNYLQKALELTLEDSARSRDYEQIIYQVSARLTNTFGRMNLKPLVIPSFHLIGAGVFYSRNMETGVWHRYIIPDVLVRLDGNYIPPELGLSRYIAVEIQRSNFNRLMSKEEKYITYNDPGMGAASKAQLYPLYLLQSNRVSSEEEGRKLIEKARRQISKALEFLPDRDDRLFYNIIYFHRSGRLEWLFPPAKEVNVHGA